MNSVKEIFNTPDHVKNYDEKTKKANWLGPEIILGMCFHHINPGEKLLDLGIGTGLISDLFHKAGLQVYGMDFSAEMLKACKKKNFAYDLKEHDLQNIPYPYETGSMDHAVCGGVMHIFENIEMIFQEVSRIVKKGGTFAFAVANHFSDKQKSKNTCHSNVKIYSHNQYEVEKLLDLYNMQFLNSLEFYVYHQGDKAQKKTFRAYLAKN